MLNEAWVWWLSLSHTTYTIAFICSLILLFLWSQYNHSKYCALMRLYHEQLEADNTVYELKSKCNIAEKIIFRWTTKNVEHYYE